MQKYTIDSVELAALLRIPQRKASQIINQVNKELEEEGYLVIKARPAKAPREVVMKRIGANR